MRKRSGFSAHKEKPRRFSSAGLSNGGGRGRNRTGVDGFATRYRRANYWSKIAQPTVFTGFFLISCMLIHDGLGHSMSQISNPALAARSAQAFMPGSLILIGSVVRTPRRLATVEA